MIVLRRPFRVFDVDVLGASLLAALLGLGYAGIWWPASLRHQEKLRSAGHLQQANANLRTAAANLESVRRQTDRIHAEIELCRASAPAVGSIPRYLNQVAAIAEASGLRIDNTIPGRWKDEATRRFVDVEFTARGTSLALTRFLDRLSRDNARQRVTAFSVSAQKGSPDGRSILSWTVRLFAQPNKPSAAERES